MGWLGFVMYGLAITIGTFAVTQWRRDQVPFWRGLGLEFNLLACPDLAVGITIGSLVMFGVFVVEWVTGVIHVQSFQFPSLGWMIWLPLMAFMAFGEELVYRSLMLNGLHVILRKPWLAVIIMASFFGLAHAGNPDASVLSVLGNALGGLVYGVAFLGSGRIWLPFGLHFAWNVIQSPVLGFPFLGREIGLVQVIPLGSAIINGGSYGPEAGLIGMVFRFVAIALLLGWLSWRPERRNKEETL